jgi:hypothetical protein
MGFVDVHIQGKKIRLLDISCNTASFKNQVEPISIRTTQLTEKVEDI